MPRCSLPFLLAIIAAVRADLYDVVQPHLKPPAGGCKAWADLPQYDKYWVGGKPPTGVGSACVQQGLGNPEANFGMADMGTAAQAHTIASYCVSVSTGKMAACTSFESVPEQVNVQIASGDAVVVAFVTYETADPAGPPIVSLNGTEVQGVTHKHSPCVADPKNSKKCPHGGTSATHYMHFVRLADLEPRASYTYTVKSGGAKAVWSAPFTFRAPYTEGVTRIALYGDMGVYTWNNMQNLYEETTLNQTSDLILHAGDHCYNEGDDDEKRADAYMQAFEKAVGNAPWMPIVGNHEFYAGTNLTRYLDSTWEKWDPLDGGEEWGHPDEGLGGSSSATSALGAFLSTGNHHGPGVHAAVPSKTSRYFSVDFGLTHLVALSLNGYNGVDTCTDVCNEAQKAWLHQDLAAVNRSKTPWVIAMSHFPMYLTAKGNSTPNEGTGAFADEAWWTAEKCEGEGHARNCTGGDGWAAQHEELKQRAKSANPHAGISPAANADLEPIFYEYGVDIYWAGHIHFYNRFDGPIFKGKVISKGTVNPKGTIHSCTGNGGPPSPSKCTCAEAGECTKCIAGPYSYTRFTAFNATDILWEQISNKDNSVVDSWTLHQESHGKFPTPAW